MLPRAEREASVNVSNASSRSIRRSASNTVSRPYTCAQREVAGAAGGCLVGSRRYRARQAGHPARPTDPSPALLGAPPLHPTHHVAQRLLQPRRAVGHQPLGDVREGLRRGVQGRAAGVGTRHTHTRRTTEGSLPGVAKEHHQAVRVPPGKVADPASQPARPPSQTHHPSPPPAPRPRWRTLGCQPARCPPARRWRG